MLFHKRRTGRKQFSVKAKGLEGTCDSKICLSRVVVHGKIVHRGHGGIASLQIHVVTRQNWMQIWLDVITSFAERKKKEVSYTFQFHC